MANKTRATILTILQEARLAIHRTRLVKLVYLADNLFYEHFGRTITGLQYMWDDFGPNAISNAVVREADRLVRDDYVCMKVGTSIYGSENYMYSLGAKKTDIPEKLLEPLERQVLRDTVRSHRRHSLSQVVAASKRTKPFKDVAQYGVLEMEQSSEYAELVKAVQQNSEFMAGVAEGTKADAEAEGLPLQEVKRKYGI